MSNRKITGTDDNKKREYKKARKPRKRTQKSDQGSLLESKDYNNNPNWYYLDAGVAEVTSRLSFQQLAGLDIPFGNGENRSLSVPNIITMRLNPSPGFQNPKDASTNKSGINLAGFREFTKLSALTGRIAVYGPQDISTLVLAIGEVISQLEFERRAFGIAYQMNMRNRAYPKAILAAMNIDSDDFFKKFSDYRTRFNLLVTQINQLPIPQSIAYFDKCAALYEHIYLDMPSAMAQTIIPVPSTSWILDETSYSGGTILTTTDFVDDVTGVRSIARTFNDFLDITEAAINALLNSSTLQVVYADLLNMANKMNTQFWRMDWLTDGYMIAPEYDPNFLLQMHNATTLAVPTMVTNANHLSDAKPITPYNDVYPDPNQNIIFYCPVFGTGANTSRGMTACPKFAIIDTLNDNPTVEDRVEMTRFTSIASDEYVDPITSGTFNCMYNATMPDHYVTYFGVHLTNTSIQFVTTMRAASQYGVQSGLLSVLDWAPRIFETSSDSMTMSGYFSGDLNFYTTIDYIYLKKLNDFIALALYDLRQ